MKWVASAAINKCDRIRNMMEHSIEPLFYSATHRHRSLYRSSSF